MGGRIDSWVDKLINDCEERGLGSNGLGKAWNNQIWPSDHYCLAGDI